MISRLSFDITNKQELELFHKQLDLFIAYNKQSTSDHFDIHLVMDDNYVEIDYIQIPYDNEDNYDGKFIFLNYDEVVMKEEVLPDNSIILVHDDAEYQEELKNWLTDHPTWKQNDFGRWYDEEEDKKFREEYLNESSKSEKEAAND